MHEAHMLHVLRVAWEIRLDKRPYDQRGWFTAGGQGSDLGGYMCFDKEFKRLGLRVHLRQGMPAYPIFGPRGDEWLAEDALANLLDLNEVESRYLFGEVDDICLIDGSLPDEVIHSIDRCIERVQSVLDGEFAGAGSWLDFRFPR